MDNKRKCPICGKDLGRNKKACSRVCYAQLRQNYKTCIICGEKFAEPKSSDKITCSPKCSRKHRQNLVDAGATDKGLEKAHRTIPTLPHTGKFETNKSAKTWVIQSPSGEIYECRNLYNWLREHDELLDGTVAQAWDGITKIKYSMQGKRKHINHQWKGWRLLDWGEG